MKDKLLQLIDTRIQTALQSFLTGHTQPSIINDMFELKRNLESYYERQTDRVAKPKVARTPRKKTAAKRET